MRIALIIPTLKQGGAERVISELANQFVRSGHDVYLILLARAQDFYVVDKRVKIFRLGFQNRNRIQKSISEVKTLLKLRKLLKKHKPDATMSFMQKYNSFTIFSAAFLNMKVYISDRSNPLKKIAYFNKLLKRFTYRYATGIVAQTQLAKEILIASTNNRNVKVIANPIKKIDMLPSIKREKIILNVGRLVEEKGQKYLLEAFARIKSSEWRLTILGDGPLRSDLETQIRELEIQDRVELPGAIKDIDFWLAKSSVFVFSSISEGFPNALCEAMAAGLPCISFDCDAGPRDLIKHRENGFLVTPKNVKDLTSVMDELIEDENLRINIGEKAKEIKDRLSLKKVSLEYIEFISR